ncbi:MAG: hypothetical protein MJZ55_05815 [Paludibacteraceae bacterium]|nr:hypothetical protein [Paludibacteraceae bacterium]
MRTNSCTSAEPNTTYDLDRLQTPIHSNMVHPNTHFQGSILIALPTVPLTAHPE